MTQILFLHIYRMLCMHKIIQQLISISALQNQQGHLEIKWCRYYVQMISTAGMKLQIVEYW